MLENGTKASSKNGLGANASRGARLLAQAVKQQPETRPAPKDWGATMTKKRILLVATGGTIASKEEGNGLSPALSGEELTRFVPEVADLATLDVKQAMNIDSTNMRPSDWLRVARTIMESYDDYDGFVVLHGTDTMAYTAAALSYLIQPVPKRVVRNRRRRERRVDRVRRHRHRGNPRAQAAHHELQRLHQRELPAARLYPHRPYRALRPFRACKEGGRATRSNSRSPRRVRQARPARVRAETHARTRFADLLGFGARASRTLSIHGSIRGASPS